MEPVSTLEKRKMQIGPRFKERAPDSSNETYYVEDSFNAKSARKKGISIHVRIEESKVQTTPGPGYYSPKFDFQNTSIPIQGSRPPIVLSENNCSPGPSNYDIPSEFGKSIPPQTIHKRITSASEVDDNPGFKYNNLSGTGSDSPRWTFPKSSPPIEVQNGFPGPGSYEEKLPNSTALGPTIHEKDTERKNTSPYPKYTNISMFPESKGFKIGQRFPPIERKEDSVGYQFVSPPIGGKQIIIRNRFKESTAQQSPGPSDYFPNDPTKRSETSFTLKGPSSRADWMPKDLGVPGPGSYDISHGNDLPKWTLGEKSIKRKGRSMSARREASKKADPMRKKE